MERIYSTKNSNLIIRDRYVLVMDNKDNRRFFTVNMGKVRIGKKEIDMSFFENKHINSFWDVDNQPYVEISNQEFFNEKKFEDEEADYDTLMNAKINNKEIYSLGAQKLSSEHIKELKEKGMKGDELIKLIIDNNASMEKRTIFSQEKILKKKGQKHKHQIWIAPTNLFNIIETLFIDDAKRINYLRMDTVSTMLIYSSFIKDATTLIYEETENILTSAYASRSSHKSEIVSLFDPRINTRNLNLFNLRRRNKYIISYLNIDYLTDPNSFYFKLFTKKYHFYFKNLVLCLKSEVDLVKIALQLLDYLSYSGNIVVFYKELEPLVALEKIIFENKIALDVKIHETFLREFQVLPARTHPMMNNKGFSGYVLTAIKVMNTKRDE